MKHIKNFTIFLFESEEFTEEDYLNWKEFTRKKHARWRGILPNYKPTEEEGESARKYRRLRKKGLDPIAPFQKKEEVFTEEDYRNLQGYYRKYSAKPRLEPTQEERQSYNKYYRLKNRGLDPIAPFQKKEKKEEEFTKEDHLNWKEHQRKKNILPSYKPTEKERESILKYQRIRRRGLDPIAPFRKKEEEEFTKEDYLNQKQYKNKKKKGISPTGEERESYNKYNRLRMKGLDPIAPFRKKEEEEFTKEDYLNWQQYTKKKNILPNFKPTEEERESYNKYFRFRTKGLDPIAPFKKNK